MRTIIKLILINLTIVALIGCEAPAPAGTGTAAGGGEGGSGGAVAASAVAPEATPTASPTAEPTPTPTPTETPPAENHAPALSVPNQSVSENSALSFYAVGTDADSNTLSYSCSANCPSGLAINSSTGQIQWTPTYSQAGSYLITFAVNDGLLSTTVDSTITVNNTNRAPTVTHIAAQSVNENQTLTITPAASDPDGDGLVISASGLPSGATFSSGTFSYAPSYAQAGQYEVSFTASDGALSATETVTITVNNVNRAPVLAAIGDRSVSELGTLSFTTSATDADGDTVTVTASNLPTGATFSNNAFSWTPSCTAEGSYTPTFTASDGVLTDAKTITITVNHSNCYTPAWQVNPSEYSRSGDNIILTIGSAVDYDEGAILTYAYVAHYDCNNKNWTVSFNSSNRRLNLTNLFPGDLGYHTFVVKVTDNDGAINYRFVQVAGSGGSFAFQKVDQGSSYSTVGLCGAGTVYSH